MPTASQSNLKSYFKPTTTGAGSPTADRNAEKKGGSRPPKETSTKDKHLHHKANATEPQKNPNPKDSEEAGKAAPNDPHSPARAIKNDTKAGRYAEKQTPNRSPLKKQKQEEAESTEESKGPPLVSPPPQEKSNKDQGQEEGQQGATPTKQEEGETPAAKQEGQGDSGNKDQHPENNPEQKEQQAQATKAADKDQPPTNHNEGQEEKSTKSEGLDTINEGKKEDEEEEEVEEEEKKEQQPAQDQDEQQTQQSTEGEADQSNQGDDEGKPKAEDENQHMEEQEAKEDKGRGVSFSSDAKITHNLNLAKGVTDDWRTICPSAVEHKDHPAFSGNESEAKTYKTKVDDTLAKMEKESKGKIAFSNKGPPLDQLKKVVRNSFCPKKHEYNLEKNTIHAIRRLATRATKTPPRKILGDSFKWVQGKQDQAVLADDQCSRFWVACNHAFGGAWRYDRGPNENDWKDSVQEKETTQEQPKPNNPHNDSITLAAVKMPGEQLSKVPWQANQQEQTRVKAGLRGIDEALRESDSRARLLEFNPDKGAKPEPANRDTIARLTSFTQGSKYLEKWREPNKNDGNRGCTIHRIRIRHSIPIDELIPKMNAFLDNRVSFYKPLEVKKASIQEVETAKIGWLPGLNPKVVNLESYEKELRSCLTKRGCNLDVQLKADKIELNLEDSSLPPAYAIHIMGAKKHKDELEGALEALYSESTPSSELPEYVRTAMVNDISADDADADNEGTSFATILMANHISILKNQKVIEREDFKDLKGHRMGGDGTNLQKLLMSIVNPANKDPDNKYQLIRYVGQFASDPTKHNVVVDKKDYKTTKRLMNALPFSVEDCHGEKVAKEWITAEGIAKAKKMYTKSEDGCYKSALTAKLKRTAGRMASLDMNWGSEERAVEIEITREAITEPRIISQCLISNPELLEDFKIEGKKAKGKSSSSLGGCSMQKSESSLGKVSMGNSEATGKSRASGKSRSSLMYNLSIAESEESSDSGSLAAGLSMANSSITSKKSRGSLAGDLTMGDSEDESAGEDENQKQHEIDLSGMETDNEDEDESEMEDDDSDYPSATAGNKDPSLVSGRFTFLTYRLGCGVLDCKFFPFGRQYNHCRE